MKRAWNVGRWRGEAGRPGVWCRGFAAVGLWALVAAWPLSPLSAGPAAGPASMSAAEKAAALSIVGRQKGRDGDYRICAELYHQAFETDPSLPAYLYSAALCETRAELLDRAETSWRRFLSVAAADEPLRSKATGHLEGVRMAQRHAALAAQAAATRRAAREERTAQERRASAAVSPPAAVTPAAASLPAQPWAAAGEGPAATGAPPPTVQLGQPAWLRPIAWFGVGGGVALTGLGVWFVTDATQKAAALSGQLAIQGPGGGIVGVTREQALERQRAANLRLGLGGALSLAGVAAAVAGAWVLLVPEAGDVGMRPEISGRTLALHLEF